MKKGTAYLTIFIGLGVLFFGTPLLIKNNTSNTALVLDLFNPFVKHTEVYVKTTEEFVTTYETSGEKKSSNENKQEGLNYVYVTTSYNNKGKKRDLKYISFGKKLTPNKYLKVTNKGQNVRKWEEVSEKEVPKEALEQLN